MESHDIVSAYNVCAEIDMCVISVCVCYWRNVCAIGYYNLVEGGELAFFNKKKTRQP